MKNNNECNFLLSDYYKLMNPVEQFQWRLFNAIYLKLKELNLVINKSDVYMMKHRLTDLRVATRFAYRGCILLDHPKESVKLVDYNYETLTFDA